MIPPTKALGSSSPSRIVSPPLLLPRAAAAMRGTEKYASGRSARAVAMIEQLTSVVLSTVPKAPTAIVSSNAPTQLSGRRKFICVVGHGTVAEPQRALAAAADRPPRPSSSSVDVNPTHSASRTHSASQSAAHGRAARYDTASPLTNVETAITPNEPRGHG